jgi:hypothetical protein
MFARRIVPPLNSTRRHRLARARALALFALGCTLGVASFAADEEVPVLVNAEVAAALVVKAEPRCSEVRLRSPEAKVRWSIVPAAVPESKARASLMAAAEFRIDVSKFASGLKSQRFDSITLSRSAARAAHSSEAQDSTPPSYSAVMRDLEPGVYYHTRVLAKSQGKWVASAPIGFLSSICAADGIEDE